jgi:hypothetical protein
MLRTPSARLRTGNGVNAAATLQIFREARDYFLKTGEDDYDADRLAKVAVKQLRRATHIQRDTTFILSRANLEFIANARAVL